MSKKYNKIKIALVSCLTLATSIIAPLAQAEVSGAVSVTNDYRFRGVSQSAGDFALQGNVDWSGENGLFAGAWASQVDFDDPEDGNGASVEVDLYFGYAGEINEELTYDVTLYRYNYPGDDVSQDYFEVSAAMDFNGFRAAYWFTNDYAGSDADLHYTELNYSYELAENWSLDLHYGYNFGDAIDDGEGFDSYSDYSVGVSTEIEGFALSLAWLDNDLSGDYKVNDGSFKTKGTFLASVSYGF